MIFPIAPFSEDECGFRPSGSTQVEVISRKIIPFLRYMRKERGRYS